MMTYSPLTIERVNRNLVTPIPVGSILSPIQAGSPVHRLHWREAFQADAGCRGFRQIRPASGNERIRRIVDFKRPRHCPSK